MPRRIAAVLLGVVTAFVLVAVIQKLGHLVYPPPADLSLLWFTVVAVILIPAAAYAAARLAPAPS